MTPQHGPRRIHSLSIVEMVCLLIRCLAMGVTILSHIELKTTEVNVRTLFKNNNSGDDDIDYDANNKPNTAIKQLTVLLRIQKYPASVLGPKTSHSDISMFF
jgi:hypothetical protein